MLRNYTLEFHLFLGNIEKQKSVEQLPRICIANFVGSARQLHETLSVNFEGLISSQTKKNRSLNEMFELSGVYNLYLQTYILIS